MGSRALILREDLSRKRFEVVAIAIFTFGCLLDHVTTAYGLTLPNVAELNVNVLLLSECDIWHIVEILIIAAGIVSGVLLFRGDLSFRQRSPVTALLIVGFIRFVAGVHNITVILNV